MKRFLRLIRCFCTSKAAIAVPVTFLILLVSTLGIVALTYYFSVERISAQGTSLKVSNAKQDFLMLDDAITSTLWKPGSSATFELKDSAGRTLIEPEKNKLTLTLNNSEVSATIYSTFVGQIIYQLPYSTSSQTGLYLKGDSKSITSDSGASMSQLCIVDGIEYDEIQLRYRPTLSHTISGVENGRIINSIRIYVVNVNQSIPTSVYGTLPLDIISKTTLLYISNFQVSSKVDNISLTSNMAGSAQILNVPISTNVQGAIINVEIVECNISIERWHH